MKVATRYGNGKDIDVEWAYTDVETEHSLAYMKADNDPTVRHLRPHTDSDRVSMRRFTENA